jgi:lipid-A-disaccharide synthase
MCYAPLPRDPWNSQPAQTDDLLAEPPGIFIGVDAPDFNLDLEADLRQQGIKTVHFVCPSVWAWRPERLEKIRRSVDHVLCIFPFEPALLAQHGIAATYVGHPLASVIPMQPDRVAARHQLGLADADTVVALLPGSRESEDQAPWRKFFFRRHLSFGNRCQVLASSFQRCLS